MCIQLVERAPIQWTDLKYDPKVFSCIRELPMRATNWRHNKNVWPNLKCKTNNSSRKKVLNQFLWTVLFFLSCPPYIFTIVWLNLCSQNSCRCYNSQKEILFIISINYGNCFHTTKYEQSQNDMRAILDEIRNSLRSSWCSIFFVIADDIDRTNITWNFPGPVNISNKKRVVHWLFLSILVAKKSEENTPHSQQTFEFHEFAYAIVITSFYIYALCTCAYLRIVNISICEIKTKYFWLHSHQCDELRAIIMAE